MLLKYDDVVYDMDDGDQTNDLIYNILSEMSDSYIVPIWNEYCDSQDYFEEHIYSMDFLEEYLIMTEKTAYDVITGNVIDSDCFCYQENWFIDSMWGLKSSNDPWDLVDFDDPDFRTYFEDMLLKDPEKYDCEEVDEEDSEEEE